MTAKDIEEMSLEELEYSLVLGRGHNILVVDDEPVIHEVLEQFLEDCGYQIDSVLTGEDAIDKVKSCDYNVLIVDKNLPKMSGIDVMSEARKISRDLEFIVITAYASYESAVEALRLGAFDYIEKPFSNQELVKEKVHKAIERQSLTRENQVLADELRQAHMNFRESANALGKSIHEVDSVDLYLKSMVKKSTQELVFQNTELTQAHFIRSEKMAAFGQLGAGVIHEVKNPMTGIVGFAQVGQNKVENPDKARELFVKIEREALRCKEILASFLKFSRSDTHHKAIIDLNRVVEEASRVFGHTLSMHKVMLDVQLGEGLPRIQGNTGQLQQVLLNLAMNAQQAMPEGGRVEIRTLKSDDDSAVITVSDNGPGMPEEVCKQIFEPFFTTKISGEGTGLGLAISYGIIRDHRGWLSVKSEVGRGTRFLIKLPAAEGLEASEKADPERTSA